MVDKRFKYQFLKPITGLIIILLVYLALAVTISQVMHFSRALDEGYHLEYIMFVKQHGRLPITYEERAQITRADFPPLYHLLVAAVSAPVNIDPSPKFKLFWDSFRYRAVDHQLDNIWVLDTEDFQRPYLDQFLVWQIGRWLSIGLSLCTLVVVFLALRSIPFENKMAAALIGTALLAFIPRYIILGSSLNDDNLLGLLAALYFLMLVNAVNKPQTWWPFIGMGIFLGLSMTVKYTLLLIPVEIVLVCLIIAKNQGQGWRWAGKRMMVVGVVALMCASWWFGWNLWYLNTVAQDGWFTGLLRPLMAGGSDATMNRISGLVSGGKIGLAQLPEDTTVGTFSDWILSTFFSFWGAGSTGESPFSPYIYIFIVVLLAVSLFGLWRLWQTRVEVRLWLSLLIFHVIIFFILPLIRFGLTRRLSVAAQGRHILIPAAVAVVALLVWGLMVAFPKNWWRLVFTGIVIVFIGWSGAHIYQLTVFGPDPLPLRSIPQASEWLPHPVKITFGETMELVSYDIDPQPGQGILHINLAWRVLAYTNENYLLKIELRNSNGEVVSHWIGYNGGGRLPTLTWDPNDTVFDRLSLPLPNLSAGTYRVQLQVLGSAGPLSVNQNTILSLPDITLDEPSHLVAPRTVNIRAENETFIEVAFDLWDTTGVQTAAPPYYRYPATITVVVAGSELADPALKLALVDETGYTWPAEEATGNIYTFIIGPRWPSGRYRLQMILQRDNDIIGETLSEPLLTVENWWKREFEVPEIAVPIEANLANQVKFLGYKLPQKRVKAGEAFPLTLYWQALDRAPQADFIQFNHLLDSSGTLWGGYDRRPLEYYSTLLWAPGEVVIDGYAVPVEANAPPGEYFLDVGYYLTVGESAVNLPLVKDGQRTDITSVTVGPIEVVAP